MTDMKTSGFTLIELMIVIAIIGILASVAVPQYGAYVQRSKFTEVVNFTYDRKTAVSICAQVTGTLKGCSGDKASSGQNGIPEDAVNLGQYTASITTVDGVITATANDKLNNADYRLIPTKEDGRITWTREGSCREPGLNLCP